MNEKRFSALILAAGFSSRMGGFKPLLRIGGKTLVEHAVGLFNAAGIDDIVTVVGHRAEELIPVVERTASKSVINERHHDGMFSSVQAGVKALSPDCGAFFLLPVDIPFVRPSTILTLVRAFLEKPATLVCYPRFQDRRGHPPLIGTGLVEEILGYNGEDGLRGLLRRYADRSLEVSVADPFIRLDADTPADLALLRETYQQEGQS